MPSVSTVPRMVRNAGRLQQVISVLTKYGLAPWLRHVPSKWVQRHLNTADGVAITNLTGPERVREAITEIGTTFIKLGQILSTRPDIVGLELAEELSRLQSQTPPDPTETIRQIISDELGQPLDALFQHFDDKPLASASIGQVHQATLLDGSEVVVKVQHSGIESKIRNDLEIAVELARLAESYSEELALYQPVATIAELRRTLLAELDFRQELRNLQVFSAHFRNDARVRFPKAYPDFSTPKVLTMELLRGVHVSSIADISATGENHEQVANTGALVFLDMVFRDRFFHADPHPGNLLLMEGGVIGIIDCGMVGRIDDHLREQLESLLMAVGDADVDHIVDLIVTWGSLPTNFDRNSLLRDIEDYFDRFGCLPLDQINVGEAMADAIATVRTHRIRLPARVAMLVRMLAVLEGFGAGISPKFHLMDLLQSYKIRIMMRRLSPRRFQKKAKAALRHWSHLIDIVPGDVADILDRVKQGSFDVHLQHRRLDTIVNRLVLGIITAAFFVGASLLLSHNVPPHFGSYSIPGCLSFLIAIYLTVRVLRAIRSSGDV